MLLNSFVVLVLVNLISGIITMDSTREMEGYPIGYLSDCPGSTKPAELSKKSLSKLTLSTVAPPNNRLIFGKRKMYNYFQMKLLAKDPKLDFRKKTLLFVSGYLDNPDFLPSFSIRNHYLKLNYNVLVLDTSYFTSFRYARASRIVRAVGKYTAKMLMELVEEGLDPTKLELLGLSLGCQTSSFIAKSFKAYSDRNISRITALDPAGPCFRHLGPTERLDLSDADFVDVISTNIDGFGMAAPVGHANFYVNGGEYQPGDVTAVWEYSDIMSSHIKSLFLWLAALENPGKFIALKCDSVQQARYNECFDRVPLETNTVGLDTNRNVQGIFYLATSNAFPYYLGKDGLKKENMVWNKMLEVVNNDAMVVV